MRKLFTAAAIVGAFLSTGCASRVYVAPAPRAVIIAPAPVFIGPVCRLRTVRVVRPSGRVVFRRVRVCR